MTSRRTVADVGVMKNAAVECLVVVGAFGNAGNHGGGRAHERHGGGECEWRAYRGPAAGATRYDARVRFYYFEIIGTAVFAVTGVLAVTRRGLDIFGAAVLGMVTALGGGTVRDVIIGTPPFWLGDANYIWAAVFVAALPLAAGEAPGAHEDYRDAAAAAYQRKDYAESKKALLAALALRPDSPQYLHHLAAVSALLGDSASAEYAWDCLVDAMREFDGRLVGLTSLS